MAARNPSPPRSLQSDGVNALIDRRASSTLETLRAGKNEPPPRRKRREPPRDSVTRTFVLDPHAGAVAPVSKKNPKLAPSSVH